MSLPGFIKAGMSIILIHDYYGQIEVIVSRFGFEEIVIEWDGGIGINFPVVLSASEYGQTWTAYEIQEDPLEELRKW